MRSVALIVALLLLTSTQIPAQTNAETTNPDARRHWDLAYDAMRANQHGAAAEEYRLAAQADPKFAEAYYYRGLFLVLQSFVTDKSNTPPAGAAESFQMYLALQPAGRLASDSLSMLKELGAPAQAEEVTRRAKAILAAEPAQQSAATQKPVEAPSKVAAIPPPVAAPTHATSSAVVKPNSTPKPVPAKSTPPDNKPVSKAKSTPTAKSNSRDSAQVAAVRAEPKSGSARGTTADDGNSAFLKPMKPVKPSALRATGAPAGTPGAGNNQCVRYAVTHGGVCGSADAVEIRAWNICPQPSAIQVCLEDTAGRWNCAISLHSRQRNSYTGVDGAMQYVCHGTGRTRALSLPSAAALPIFPPVAQ
jgi:hypothetical protein